MLTFESSVGLGQLTHPAKMFIPSAIMRAQHVEGRNRRAFKSVMHQSQQRPGLHALQRPVNPRFVAFQMIVGEGVDQLLWRVGRCDFTPAQIITVTANQGIGLAGLQFSATFMKPQFQLVGLCQISPDFFRCGAKKYGLRNFRCHHPAPMRV